jgi:hypothetical protein
MVHRALETVLNDGNVQVTCTSQDSDFWQHRRCRVIQLRSLASDEKRDVKVHSRNYEKYSS